MSKTKTPSATQSEHAPSKRPSAAKTKKDVAELSYASLSLIDIPGVAPINVRKVRPVPALLPSVRAARLLDPADEAQPSPTAEPTPLHFIHLNSGAVSLDAFLSRLAPQATIRSLANAPSTKSIQHPALAPSQHGKPASAPALRHADDFSEPSSVSSTPKASTTKLHRPIDPKLASNPAPRSFGRTLAERLEMTKLAREAEVNAIPHPALPIATATATATTDLLPLLPRPIMRPTIVASSQSLPATPDATPLPLAAANSSVLAARDTLLGVALAYADDFQLHIGGPVAALWQHRASVAAAMVHVFIPLLMAYAFSHWNPSMQAIFLEGGLLPNLGKLCWLFIVSAFGWTLVYIISARMLQSLKFDWGRFERIGRGFMSPHRHDD